MSGPTCDALNDLFSQGAFKDPIDFLGVLFYASISNSNLVLPTLANFLTPEMFPMTMEEFIAKDKASQVESGFIDSEIISAQRLVFSSFANMIPSHVTSGYSF